MITGCLRAGSQSWSPGTGLKARPRSSCARAGRTPAQPRLPQATVDLITGLRAELPAKDSTTVPTPSPGTSSTTTAWWCQYPASTATWSPSASSFPHPSAGPSPPRITGPIVQAEFRKACATQGIPYSTLTDNGMVFTTRFSGGKGGRNHLESELHRLGVVQINSTPITHHLRQSRMLPPNPQKMTHRPTPRHQHRRTTNPTRPIHRPLQPPPPTPRTTPPRQPGHRLHRTPQSHPRATPRHPQPPPHRPHRPIRKTHPAPRRPTPPRRHRPNPHPHPRTDPRPRPQHQNHPRHHRRTPPPANTGPHQGLPTPRHPHRPPKEKTRTLNEGSDNSDVLRHHKSRGGGIRTHGLFVPNEARYQAAPHPA